MRFREQELESLRFKMPSGLQFVDMAAKKTKAGVHALFEARRILASGDAAGSMKKYRESLGLLRDASRLWYFIAELGGGDFEVLKRAMSRSVRAEKVFMRVVNEDLKAACIDVTRPCDCP